MFLDLNQNAKANLIKIILFMIPAMAWGIGNSYTNSELRELETSEEAQIRTIRVEEVKQLRVILGRHAPINQRAEFYFRLAEIYLETYRSEFLLEGRVHEKRLEKGMVDKFIDRSHSKPYIRAGI